ncbi:MAG: hypothetical protein HOV92_00720 [Streptomyces sp.]|nr:hypothetical protein [Streptomyces sp.]
MICARCDQPIMPSEKYEAVDKFSPSGTGGTLHVHKKPCKPTLTQTAPESERWR